ncbi:hypothetical protein BaRGS_00023645 [Batillaria attramentaria]|uniref:Uncharacterized protein n=1 Tax=Batillaria attramentaria TaxID=370345 RepID=A0ABD0KDT2_9CAEN
MSRDLVSDDVSLSKMLQRREHWITISGTPFNTQQEKRQNAFDSFFTSDQENQRLCGNKVATSSIQKQKRTARVDATFADFPVYLVRTYRTCGKSCVHRCGCY